MPRVFKRPKASLRKCDIQLQKNRTHQHFACIHLWTWSVGVMSGSPLGVEEEKGRGREATKSLSTTCCHWDVGERSSSSSTLLESIRTKGLSTAPNGASTGAQPRASLGIPNRTSDTSGRSWLLAVNLVLDKLIIPPAYGVAQDVSQRARLTSRLDRHARLKFDRVTAGLLHQFTSCSPTFFL